MPASLNFTPLAIDATVWFANATAFNDFMSNITVNITATDLPAASTTTAGVVKKALIAAYSAALTPVTLTYYAISSDQDGDGINETYYAIEKTCVESIIAKLTAIETSHSNLLTGLLNAGSLSYS